jgi:excinuclease ABC subunit A
MADSIPLRGVRVHNLKGVNVDLPLGKLTVFSGVSGSGKSSLAFDTLYAEAQRRYLQSFSAYTRQFLDRLDKPEAELIGSLPPAVAVGQRFAPRGPRATVGTMTEILDYLQLLFARTGRIFCLKCGDEVRAQQTADVLAAAEALPAGTRFSVAFPARPESDGGGNDWAASLKEEGFVRVQINGSVIRLGEQELPKLSGHEKIWVLVDRLEADRFSPQRLTDSAETAFARGHGQMALLTDQQELVFDQRARCPRCDILYPALEPRLFRFNDPLGACPTCQGTGSTAPGGLCPTCGGSRLNEQALSARIGGRNIGELCALTISELTGFIAAPRLEEALATGKLLMEQIRARLDYLLGVGLGYLSLNRSARSLSTGEAQRVRLTTALGSNLVSALYVLDEPTVGLHPRDTDRLLAVLLRLRDIGNTVVVVEHDPEVYAAADYLVDLGPGAGEEGGEVLYQGPAAGVVDCEASITGSYLGGRRQISIPARRRPINRGSIRVVGAKINNLQDLTVDFPLGLLCAVTGVSGAGKSSLVQHTLYPALARRKHKKLQATTEGNGEVIGAGQIGDVVLMDQTPLARTARSNPVTSLKAFDEIRKVFADTTEARIRNFGPGHFSFNQPGGRCETCEGQGTLTVDMQFLADVIMTCPDCKGTRYKPEILNVKVRSLNIAEVLNLTAREAFRFFRAQPLIERKLKKLLDVGLDYLRLGQPADTLSGGESQRLKLAGHLASSRKPRCLFLLNEPTAGLHVADVARLLDCFDHLLNAGHSLIVVEHNLDVIKCADWVIDLGPGAASEGGRVVTTGTPEQIAQAADSYTGQWLRKVLTGRDDVTIIE